MLLYSLILLLVVLIFTLYKNKEGVDTPPLRVYLMDISGATERYKHFSKSFAEYCSYFDNGNGINNALNKLSNNKMFTDQINNCNSNNPNELKTCYANALSNNSIKWRVMYGNAPNCLDAYINNTPVPTLNNATNIEPDERKGWERVNYEATTMCAPYNSLTEIDNALDEVKSVITDKIGQCAVSVIG